MKDKLAIIEKGLQGEKWTITGSSSYDLPDYQPKDIDVCVLCDDNQNRIISAISGIFPEKLISLSPDYKVPFGWGGETDYRIKVNDFDFFMVPPWSFDIIKKTTEALKAMPAAIKQMMAIDKEFRVELFQLIARNFFKITTKK